MQENILLFFKNIATPLLDQIAEAITMLGEQYAFILIISYVYWNLSKRKGFKLAVAFLYSSLSNALLKLTFQTPRPFEKLAFIKGKRIETATGYSFPSGHVQGSTTFFISLALILKKRWFTIMALFVILAVGISRVYLGVHWPLDVVGGWVFGSAAAFIFCALIDRYFDELDKLKLILFWIQGIILLFAIALLLFDLFYLHGSMKIEDFFKLSGISSGAVYGFFIEMKMVRFSPAHSRKTFRIIRFIVGVAISVAIVSGAKQILPEHYIADFFRYGLVGLWITFLWPAAGSKLKLFRTESR